MYKFSEDVDLSLLIEDVSRFFEEGGSLEDKDIDDFFEQRKRDRLAARISKAQGSKEVNFSDIKELFKDRTDCKIIDSLENKNFIFVLPLNWEGAKFLASKDCAGYGSWWEISSKIDDRPWKEKLNEYALSIVAIRKDFYKLKSSPRLKILVEIPGVQSPEIYDKNQAIVFNSDWDIMAESTEKCERAVGWTYEKILESAYNDFINSVEFPSPIGFRIEGDTVIIENKDNNYRTNAIRYSQYGKIKFDPNYNDIIPEKAFYICPFIVEVDATNTQGMGKESFFRCENLKKIILPNIENPLGEDAFRECSKLESIVFQNNTTEIAHRAFSTCSNLSHVDLPKNLKTLSWGSFGRTSISEIIIPETVRAIEGFSLDQTKIKSIQVPGRVELIGQYAFSSCENLEYVDLSKSVVTKIEEEAFSTCSNLKEIKLPKTLTEIGRNAFLNCGKLEKLIIPSNVKIIKDNAFGGCFNLKEVEFKGIDIPEIESELSFKEGTKIIVPSFLIDEFEKDKNFSKYEIIGV